MKNIYVSSPISLYNRPRYKQIRALLSFIYQRDLLLFAEGMYLNSNHWLEKWPQVLSELDMIIVCPDKNGVIGRGVYTEYLDCLEKGLPAFLLTPSDDILPLGKERISLINNGISWTSYARVDTQVACESKNT